MSPEDALPGANTLAEISGRFLYRTRNDVGRIRRLLHSRAPGMDTLQTVKELAHRLAGTSDLLGFTGLADAAGHIETLCSQDGSDAELISQLLVAVDALERQTEGTVEPGP